MSADMVVSWRGDKVKGSGEGGGLESLTATSEVPCLEPLSLLYEKVLVALAEQLDLRDRGFRCGMGFCSTGDSP